MKKSRSSFPISQWVLVLISVHRLLNENRYSRLEYLCETRDLLNVERRALMKKSRSRGRGYTIRSAQKRQTGLDTSGKQPDRPGLSAVSAYVRVGLSGTSVAILAFIKRPLRSLHSIVEAAPNLRSFASHKLIQAKGFGAAVL